MAVRTVAITGAAGFVGTHLIQALDRRGIGVISIDLEQGMDILAMDTLKTMPEFDFLVHLAGRTFVPDSWKFPRDYIETNVMGTVNCLDLCRERGARMLLASTYVYGNPQYLPVDEDHPATHWNPYASSKIMAEDACDLYARQFEVPSTILRFFNLYGHGQHPNFLMPKIVQGLYDGKLALGNSQAKRDYIYIEDAVGAILAAMDADWQGCSRYNVGSGVSHSVAEVVDLIQGALGVQAEVRYSEETRPGEVMDVIADIRRIQADLNWRPKFTIEAGVAALVKQFLAEKG